MITQGSRYTNSEIIAATVHGKPAQVIVPGTPKPQKMSFTVYVSTVSDSVEGLAERFYSDATLWWRIADANPEVLWWGYLPPGTRLRIPTTVA